jgi:hypothetical protein
MTISEQINRFSDQYGKSLSVNNTTWRYYRLGEGPPILWLTGGMRRAALGFAFMERLPDAMPSLLPIMRLCSLSERSSAPWTRYWKLKALRLSPWQDSLMAECWHRPTWRTEVRRSNGSSYPALDRSVPSEKPGSLC